MFEDKKILAIIPARAGSKGIHRKNLLKLEGQTLLERTFLQAKQSRYLDRIILSSENFEIQQVAKSINLEVPFNRPISLAGDQASSMDVVRHAIEEIGEAYDYIVLLQVTSPLRVSEDIDNCVELCVRSEARSCVSVVSSNVSPELMFTLTAQREISLVDKVVAGDIRRQASEQFFYPNGAVYIAESKWLAKAPHFISSDAVAYEMPRMRSFDLDEQEDWEIIQKLTSKLR